MSPWWEIILWRGSIELDFLRGLYRYWETLSKAALSSILFYFGVDICIVICFKFYLSAKPMCISYFINLAWGFIKRYLLQLLLFIWWFWLSPGLVQWVGMVLGRVIWFTQPQANREYDQSKDVTALTYSLTPWSRVLFEKLTGSQLVKKFPTFCGTQRFITTFTTPHRLPLSWARSIQSMHPHPISWRSILILSSHLSLGLPSGLFPSGFPTKTLYAPPSPPYMLQSPPISFFSILSLAQYLVSSTDH